LARFDDAVIDRPVAATGRAALAAARLADRVDRSGVDGAVTGVARGTARLGRLARRPETGQIYQYYLQAVLVLLAAAVFLVWVA
jgi:NADH-quinone oxidoreductase subunit L